MLSLYFLGGMGFLIFMKKGSSFLRKVMWAKLGQDARGLRVRVYALGFTMFRVLGFRV